jgi:N-acetyl-gamma-glutamyl-phosphate reductase
MPSIVVIGARGYTGAELLPLLHRHPDFQLVAVGSGSAAGDPVGAHVAGMEGCELRFADLRPESLEGSRFDACVLALPNGAAAAYVDVIDRSNPDAVVVDLSADYRFDPVWVYGQPERFAERIAGARRIANPGCYATGAQLAVAPVLPEVRGLPAVFGVSGYSGAGTAPSRRNDPAVLADNLLPYSLVDHVHEREASHHLAREVRFLPHVAPFFRGISLTVAMELERAVSTDELLTRYRAFYAECPLVEVAADAPEVRSVRGRHQIAVGGFAVSVRQPTRVALVAVLDNLLKGAATQAIQNLNLAFGLEPLAGLDPRQGLTP